MIYGETNELDKAWDIYYGVSLKNISQMCHLLTG